MKRTILVSIVAMLLSGLILTACSNSDDTDVVDMKVELSGPYLGQEPPGLEPELFAPGILSTALHDDGAPIFSADGNHLFFRKWAVPHDIVGYMQQVDGVWTEPEMFKPFGKYVFSVPRFLPGTNTAFFISRRPVSGEGDPADYNVWRAELTEDGWTNLEHLDSPLNTSENEYAYSVSANGTIYLQANLEDSLGRFDFYSSEVVDGVYQKAQNLGAPVNTEASESAPFISPDGSYLVYCGLGYEDTLGGIDLFVAFKNEDGTWTPGINLGEGVNTRFDDKFPSISPDGKYIFFVSDPYPDRSYVFTDMNYQEMMKRNLGSKNGLGGDVYWVSAEVVHRLNPNR